MALGRRTNAETLAERTARTIEGPNTKNKGASKRYLCNKNKTETHDTKPTDLTFFRPRHRHG